MKVFIGLNGHTNQESLPLRFGISITETHQQFASLEDDSFDPNGTNRQRQDEIERGNKHYRGTLAIPNVEQGKEPYRCLCRVVLGIPKNDQQSPPVVTILTQEYSHGDLTVTKHISGMVKRGRISLEDIINFLHPEYMAGNVKDSNDVEEIYSSTILPSRSDPITSTSINDAAIIESSSDILNVIESFSIEDSELLSVPTFKKIPLNNKVKYNYLMADAYIADAYMKDDKIFIDVIGTNTEITHLHSFKQRDHLFHHHQISLKYLQSRIGQRAYFAVCTSKPCKGFLAESVTSISLQLMKRQ